MTSPAFESWTAYVISVFSQQKVNKIHERVGRCLSRRMHLTVVNLEDNFVPTLVAAHATRLHRSLLRGVIRRRVLPKHCSRRGDKVAGCAAVVAPRGPRSFRACIIV